MSDCSEQPCHAAPGPTIDLRDTVKVISEQSHPLEVGKLEMDGDGKIRARDTAAPMRFKFVFKNLSFDAEVRADTDAIVKLRADLGKLPYTAESPEVRRAGLRAIMTARRMPRGRLWLSDQQDIQFAAEAVPPKPRTPVSIVATLTALLLDFKPYLTLLGEALSTPGSPPVGRSIPDATGS